MDRSPSTKPSVFYSPPISEKTIEDFEDGIWYFHVRLRNIRGWGVTSHFRFQIDTESPESFDITFPDGKETTNIQPVINFNTTDGLSGISHYELKITDGDLPDTRRVLVRAFDNAGNYTDAIDKFTILTPPKIPTTNTLRLVIFFMVLVFLLTLWYMWRRFIIFKERLRKKVHKAKGVLYKAFDLLREDVRKKEEKKVIKHLKKDLEETESSIGKEIENIEKEIK